MNTLSNALQYLSNSVLNRGTVMTSPTATSTAHSAAPSPATLADKSALLLLVLVHRRDVENPFREALINFHDTNCA